MQWSPDGKSIAYLKGWETSRSSISKPAQNPAVAGAARRQTAEQHSYLYWAWGWSNDGQIHRL